MALSDVDFLTLCSLCPLWHKPLPFFPLRSLCPSWLSWPWLFENENPMRIAAGAAGAAQQQRPGFRGKPGRRGVARTG